MHRRRPVTLETIDERLDRVELLLSSLARFTARHGVHMSIELDQLVAEVTRTREVGASVITLVKGLSAKLQAAVDESADHEALKAALVGLGAELDASNDSIADAVVANTPAAPEE